MLIAFFMPDALLARPDLRNNHLSADGAVLLARALKVNDTLQTLVRHCITLCARIGLQYAVDAGTNDTV